MFPEVAAFRQWLHRKSPHSSTAQDYGFDLKTFFEWSGKPPRQITVRDIDAFIGYCQDKKLAIGTINRRLCALRSFYSFLEIELDDPPPNPVLPKRHFIKVGRRLPRDVEDDVISELFAVIHRIRDQAMFLIMLRCGLRVGEVRDLKLDDLLLRPPRGGAPRLRVTGKGNVQRVVFLASQPLEALQAWLAERPKSKVANVFLNRFGGRYSVTGIQRLLVRYCRKAQVSVTCHQFRHYAEFRTMPRATLSP
jgi:integrase